jgi:aminotransferase in exopolysaccharide biosynthesis
MTHLSASFEHLLTVIRNLYGPGRIPLHRPVFEGNERQYLVDCIDSNFVSSVGAKVTEFEERVAAFTGAGYAVATVNGTAALHIALRLAGVAPGDEVITQALTFVATCNAVCYCDAWPVFVDVDQETLGLSPRALSDFLQQHAERRVDGVFNRQSGRRLAACVPMHTFGFPCQIAEILTVCEAWGLPVVEDAAESLGSWVAVGPDAWRHTGTFGRLGTLSFNGNKIITTGGGGMLLTDDAELAARAKHLTTTAKVAHPFEFVHDALGYNYRLPNLNAALGCAQMERLPEMLAIKAKIAERYAETLADSAIRVILPPAGTRCNHWLNAVLFDSPAERNAFLAYSNGQGVMTRPIWRLMNRLDLYAHCQHDGLACSHWLEARVVNLPSSVPEGAINPSGG